MTRTHAGTVAVVGRPNVGKSTLVNRLVGERLCITAARPQTTRHRVLGVVTRDAFQFAFVDTPGIHGGASRELNRALNRAAVAALAGVDAVIFVTTGRWTEDDERVRARLAEAGEVPVVAVLNQVDRVADKRTLLPALEQLQQRLTPTAVVPLSARTGDNIDALWSELEPLMPARAHEYDVDMLTDRSQRFLAAELVREQLVRRLGEELPYATTVEIERFETMEDGRIAIDGVIWVEREGQKAIVIGSGGQQLKSIGSSARRHMQKLFDCGIHLQLWVKVRAGWSNDRKALQALGYEVE